MNKSYNVSLIVENDKEKWGGGGCIYANPTTNQKKKKLTIQTINKKENKING